EEAISVHNGGTGAPARQSGGPADVFGAAPAHGEMLAVGDSVGIGTPPPRPVRRRRSEEDAYGTGGERAGPRGFPEDSHQPQYSAGAGPPVAQAVQSRDR